MRVRVLYLVLQRSKDCYPLCAQPICIFFSDWCAFAHDTSSRMQIRRGDVQNSHSFKEAIIEKIIGEAKTSVRFAGLICSGGRLPGGGARAVAGWRGRVRGGLLFRRLFLLLLLLGLLFSGRCCARWLLCCCGGGRRVLVRGCSGVRSSRGHRCRFWRLLESNCVRVGFRGG